VTCGRLGAEAPGERSGDVIQILKRQAPVIVIAFAAACIAAGAATADPSISAKQAEAQRVMGQIQVLDSSLERARNMYDSANVKLHAIEHNLTINRIGLQAARANLVVAEHNLSQRLVTIYTAGDTQSTLGVILGATSVDDLVNRIESVQSLSSQDVSVVRQVVSFKREVTLRQHTLVRDRHAQAALVRQRAAAKARISSQLGRQQRLYNSIKGEIAHLVALQHARQLALARQAQQRYAAYQSAGHNPALDLSTGFTAPPTQYSGVVGIAMQFLGVPYVWGGSSPGGFDCSGLVMYVYAQVGVSLPHYTGAQWGMGVPVAYSDLQPGDLVFFDGLGHVGIYIGGGEFIHAPHTGDVVRIDSLSEGWYAATYDGARRITSG
jgi:cell wall-associated NlpC family hydrolase